MKNLARLAFFILFPLGLLGQSPKVDSIRHAIYSASTPQQKLSAMLALCDRFETISKDTLWKYATEAKVLATRLKDRHSLSQAIIGQANAYVRWDNIDSARALVNTELSKNSAQDPATRDIYFRLRHIKLQCIVGTTDYKDATAEAYGIIEEAEKYRDSLAIAETYNSLSIYKYELDFTKEPITLGLKGLSYTSQAPRYDDAVINLSGNLAEYYYYINKLDSAMYFADKTYNLSQRDGYLHFESWALQKKSAIYGKAKDFKKAGEAVLQSLHDDSIIDGAEPRDDNLIALADVYDHLNEFDQAIKAINDGLAWYNSPKHISPHARHDTSSYGIQRIFLYRELAKSYQKKGDSKNYEAILEKVINLTDRVYQANSAQAIADFDTRYQVQKKEATIAQQKLALVREHDLLYNILIFVCLGIVVAIMVITELRRKQKFRTRQLQEEERRQAEKAVATAKEAERRRIAADLHDNLGAQLSFIKRSVGFLMDKPSGFDQSDEKKYLDMVDDVAQSAMIDLRETLWVLNKDDVGMQEFADKLKSYLRQHLSGKGMISHDFHEDVAFNWRLSSGEVMHLFRIVQEAVSNIIKHAEADEVRISIASESADCYRLEIADNGKGFDRTSNAREHYGLGNMEKRAAEIGAKLSIATGTAGGTRLVLIKVSE